jgi:hypothetical protein
MALRTFHPVGMFMAQHLKLKHDTAQHTRQTVSFSLEFQPVFNSVQKLQLTKFDNLLKRQN